MVRKAEIFRETKETKIKAAIVIEGSGKQEIDTPIWFFNHLLQTLAFHGKFDLALSASGDIQVDQHHLVEDCGLVLGKVIRLALAEAKGINRAGFFVMPMDEALAIVAVDINGRPVLQYEASFRRRFCGDFDTDVLPDFFQAMATGLMGNVVVRIPGGRSDHHRAEAAFKALGRSLRMACSLDPRGTEGLMEVLPSLKGVIDK
ncbi:MAG: imidazoleglycerol-phosphate dehydratase HisB [Candidatus Saccharicenans sp.]|uniref:imidazoleglycerol-phosphate dehydratase HisB n=1 Tax=Candidatus Saccharicenans sp. TaxID=2819258 RepID=UPI004048F934